MLLAMIRKDLRVMLKDKKSLLITLCMPVVLTTILGFAFQGLMDGGYSLDRADMALVNLGSREDDLRRIVAFLDGPVMGEVLTAGQKEELLGLLEDMDMEKILREEVLGSPEVEKFIHCRQMEPGEARKLLEKGELAAVAVLPEGFTYNTFLNLALSLQNPLAIEVIKHPDHRIKGELVAGILTGFTDALAAGMIAKNVLMEAAIEHNAGDKALAGFEELIGPIHAGGIREIQIDKVTAEGKRAVSSFQYYAVGMAVMFILYVAANGAQYSMDEVDNGTLGRLILAGAGRARFFAAKFAATALFALLQLAILMAFSALCFKTSWGSFPGVALLSFSLAAATGALAVLLSALNLRLKNIKATIVFQAVLIQIFALLGGSFFPVAAIPLLQRLGGFTPNGAAMSGFLRLMMGYGPGEVSGALITLLAIALASCAAGAYVAAGGEEIWP